MAGAAVGLDDVAVQRDLALAQDPQVDHGAQGAPNQALDLLGAARLLALGGLAPAAGMGGAGQHAVFGRHPALAAAFQERRNAVLHRGRDQHLGVAGGDQAGAFGVAIDPRLEGDGAQDVGGTAGRTHGDLQEKGARLAPSQCGLIL